MILPITRCDHSTGVAYRINQSGHNDRYYIEITHDNNRPLANPARVYSSQSRATAKHVFDALTAEGLYGQLATALEKPTTPQEDL